MNKNETTGKKVGRIIGRVMATGQQYGAGQEGIDLFSMMDDALRCFQKYWLQFLLLYIPCYGYSAMAPQNRHEICL